MQSCDNQPDEGKGEHEDGSRELNDFLCFAAENINARVNEAAAFCKYSSFVSHLILLYCDRTVTFRYPMFHGPIILPKIFQN